MTTNTLFNPLNMGDLELANRIVMSALTRSRATHDGDVPNDLNAQYYEQRASAGLIISDGTKISTERKGYAWTPGIYSDDQVKGWRRVTDAVHAKGGRIFVQLWHVGRVSHTSLQIDNQSPVAPSALAAQVKTFDGEGFVDTSVPCSLEASEMKRVVNDYRTAALNAKAAGFDGIELHAANGYLIDQFLRDSSNRRTDAYGGSIENRTRLLIEVLDAITEVWPAARVGIRLSPFSSANDISDPMALFSHVIAKINDYGLAYLNMIEGETGGTRDLPTGANIKDLRSLFDGIYMANHGYEKGLASDAIKNDHVDLVAFGRAFIANPDLVERFAENAPLNELDADTLYGGDAAGYTDYPTLQHSAAA
ncbi:MAG: N-ethylmaleimide reductase [Cryomorphaceae bacterium]|jgi:N-ethylmaleimide reductase